MADTKIRFWKQIWRCVTTESLTEEDATAVLGGKEVLEELRLGLASYRPLISNTLVELQKNYPEQTKLLNVVQILQNYIDVDTNQTWEIVKLYLYDVSYGTPTNALKNVAFVDTRTSFLVPNIWRFYHAERLFLMHLLKYVIEFKNDKNHKYYNQFNNAINAISIQEIKKSLLSQFAKSLESLPPSRKIHTDFSSETVRQEWAEFNLREQLVILQLLLLICNEVSVSVSDFIILFRLFKKHDFGKNQGYNELLEERHKEYCLRILYMEISIFLVVVDKAKLNSVSCWIENTTNDIENELTKLQLSDEHSAMLLGWMLLSLHSEQHCKMFENHYQQYGITALRLRVFEFLHRMLNNSVCSDDSKCSKLVRLRIFQLMNDLCDKFDTDGTLGHQPGAIMLCSELLKTSEVAEQFWDLQNKEEGFGMVSFWNTALEYFPFNHSALSALSSGLAQAGKTSVRNLIAELKNLPVYTEPFNPKTVPVAKVSLDSDDIIVTKDYSPSSHPGYQVNAGSRAAIMESKEGTFIHFRTSYSYWTILSNEIEIILDRKVHNHQNINNTIQRICEGAKVLKQIISCLSSEGEVPKSLIGPCEGIFDVMIRFLRVDMSPLPLMVTCLEVCSALVSIFPKEIHLRLVNTGLLPCIVNHSLSYVEFANGLSFDSACVGSFLVALEQPSGTYNFLGTYIEMLIGFTEATRDERIVYEILLPGLVLVFREVFPNISEWRYNTVMERRKLLQRTIDFLSRVLQPIQNANQHEITLQKTCIYSLLHTENAIELLKIIAVGETHLQGIMFDESNWNSGSARKHLSTLQKAISVLMLTMRHKELVSPTNEITPMDHLIFTQNKQKGSLKVVPKVTSYINHAFNKYLPALSCRLLNRFAGEFQMSLFASLDMTPYQVRVMFLERLRDKYESVDLKIAILDFVTTCVGKQPGLTEAFFKIKHDCKIENEKDDNLTRDVSSDVNAESILSYMAEYLSAVKTDSSYLYSPLLGCIMGLFHALWKNNMQVLVKELRSNPKFWDCMTSPLFSEIQTGIRAYSQIFNVLGIELFISQEKIDPNFKEILEMFFDINKKYLDTWINYIYSLDGRVDDETTDRAPNWLSLLTSWKDFTTVFCKCMPISLNIAHKTKMVAPCMETLLRELETLNDGRLIVILSELYVIMLANWKDDCFDNRKKNVKQIDSLLSNTSIYYDSLHIRAKRALLSIATVAISSLDYQIKADSVIAQNIIRSVTNINSFELGMLFNAIKEENSEAIENAGVNEGIPPVVLSLAMLEQCLELYDDMFSNLAQWFESTRFVNNLLCCLHICIQNKKHYHTSLAALRCLTAYSRGPFSKDLLTCDIDQFLWLQLLPPKFETSTNWKLTEWWRIYTFSLDFISMMVIQHGQFFSSNAITFVGVHLEHLTEAVLIIRHDVTMDALNLCASSLNLIVHLVKYEERWRIENLNSLMCIMRSISACLYQCVTLAMRGRRPTATHPATDDSTIPSSPPTAYLAPPLLNRILEILQMATLCLLSFSPDLLSLLAEPGLDLERWQPLVELHFGAPKISYETFPQLTFGTLLSAICLLTKSLNHSYHTEETAGGSRSPRAGSSSSRRRPCSCGSPGESRRVARSESITSISSGTSGTPWLAAIDERHVAGALHATLTLLASQALLTVRDISVPARYKQLVRRELGSELTLFHDFVRKRILCPAHSRPHLVRNKLGICPLLVDEEEKRRLEAAHKERSPERETSKTELPLPPPPKRSSHDSMREFILRKQYLNNIAQTPAKELPLPVSHSTPASDKKTKESSRSSKRVSWAETTHGTEEDTDMDMEQADPVYSNLTDVQINDGDYLHFMSVVFLYICQTEL